jgi:hypothetical protein
VGEIQPRQRLNAIRPLRPRSYWRKSSDAAIDRSRAYCMNRAPTPFILRGDSIRGSTTHQQFCSRGGWHASCHPSIEMIPPISPLGNAVREHRHPRICAAKEGRSHQGPTIESALDAFASVARKLTSTCAPFWAGRRRSSPLFARSTSRTRVKPSPTLPGARRVE